MFINKKIKSLLLICLCVALAIFTQIAYEIENKYVVRELNKDKINIAEIESTFKKVDKLDIEVKLWDTEPYYKAEENIYYFLIDEKYFENTTKPKIKIETEEKIYYFSILNDFYDKDEGLYVDSEKVYDFLICDGLNYYRFNAKFTCIPMVNIITSQEITTNAQPAHVEFYMKDHADGIGTTVVSSETIIYVRGRSSLYYPKKQYRLKLRKDNDYNKVSLLGMNDDEDWILDSLYSDYSKIRTKLAFDLWNQINSYTNVDYDNDLAMEYIDVYINGEYHGLYLLKEFYDWKKLNLDRNSEDGSGILVKGIQYGEIDWNNYENAKHSQDVFPFILKYPKNLPDHSKYWDTIIPKIYSNFIDRDKITEEYLLENFYIQNYNDYNLLINFIMAMDNFEEKNVYLSMKNMKEDTKVLITPWDLDMSFGYNWGSSETNLVEDSETVNNVSNLWTKSDYINDLLSNRYWDLRVSVFNMKNINEKIDSYYNLIKHSIKRDNEKWLKTDLELETNKVREWIENRIEVLDEEFRNGKK